MLLVSYQFSCFVLLSNFIVPQLWRDIAKVLKILFLVWIIFTSYGTIHFFILLCSTTYQKLVLHAGIPLKDEKYVFFSSHKRQKRQQTPAKGREEKKNTAYALPYLSNCDLYVGKGWIGFFHIFLLLEFKYIPLAKSFIRKQPPRPLMLKYLFGGGYLSGNCLSVC